MLLLDRALGAEDAPLARLANRLGLIALLAQLVGLLRWVFVVPGLAAAYLEPTSSEATRAAVEVSFAMLNQFGGVLLGEHVGQLFTIFWMLSLSTWGFFAGRLPRWLASLGVLASLVYLLAQGELIATVLPGFPVIGPAGLADRREASL